MTKNRFEQVDEVQPDAITLALSRRGDQTFGTIHCPATLSAGRLATDAVSGEMPTVQAFRSAIRLANEIKAPIVVVDPEHVWQAEWGELYRED